MKVACLFGSLNRGGTEMLMLHLFRSVSTTQLQLIGIYRKEGVLKESFIATQQTFIHLHFRSNPFRYLYQLRKQLLEHSVGIVHAVQPIDIILAKIACAGTSIKTCQTIHGFDFSTTKIAKVLIGWSLRMADTTVFVSRYQQQVYVKTYRRSVTGKEVVVPNGIAFQRINGSSRFRSLPASKQLTFVTVGNFNAGRDQLTLCRFALRLKAEGICFQWFFAGQRTEKEAWRYDGCVDFCTQNGLSEQVIFLGSCDDVHLLLQKADLFIYASEHDTFGMAVVEALAQGIPVLVNDWPVMKEITDDGQLATIYITKEEEHFVEQLISLLSTVSPERQLEIATSVRERYSIENHINSLITKVYLPLLQL